MQKFIHSIAETFTPVLKESAFLEKGVLTPEEFIAAGDELVFKAPTWSWQSGDSECHKSYLPREKQFLITRNVPCTRRVAALETDYAEEVELERGEDGGEGWMETQQVIREESVGEIPSFDDEAVWSPMEGEGMTICGVSIVEEHVKAPIVGEDEYPDLGDFEEADLLVEDEATFSGSSQLLKAKEPDDVIMATRTYDISITYDKRYQTPRIWLFGYNEDHTPLSAVEIFEDVMQDYANRTVTIEAHPFLPSAGPHASIHPCKHAAVMQKIVRHLIAGEKAIPVTQYLFIFLKFIQSVVPTIDYDFTVDVEA